MPKGVGNLLVAGRCIGGDSVSHASARNMMCCAVSGQGAGAVSYTHLDVYKRQGHAFRSTTRLGTPQLALLAELGTLAPLHNPPALSVIAAEMCIRDSLHNDSFPASHALAVGPLGYQGSKAAMKLIAQADVCLLYTSLPYVMTFNRPAIADKADIIARVLDLPARGFEGLLGWVLELRRELGIPHSLAEIGVSVDKAEIIGREAAVDPSAGGNPLALDPAILERIFRAAVDGKLGAVGLSLIHI